MVGVLLTSYKIILFSIIIHNKNLIAGLFDIYQMNKWKKVSLAHVL